MPPLVSLRATNIGPIIIGTVISLGSGETGLKRLARQVDSGATLVHAQLAERMAPPLEAVVFVLSELRGLAGCRPWKNVLGLKVRWKLRLEVEMEAVPNGGTSLV